MDIPILQNGQAAGALRLRRDGLYTVFEARLPGGAGLRRLWVFGGGASAPLGLMEPGAEGLTLCRRLSRAAMAKLPPVLEYAALEGEAPAPPAGDSPRPDRVPPPAPAPGTLILFGKRYLRTKP